MLCKKCLKNYIAERKEATLFSYEHSGGHIVRDFGMRVERAWCDDKAATVQIDGPRVIVDGPKGVYVHTRFSAA